MSSLVLPHEFFMGFDESSFDRLNGSTVAGYGAELDVIADDDPHKALSLMHNVLGHYQDITMQSIHVRTESWSVSMAEDGHYAARSILLSEIGRGMLGSTYGYPAHIVLLVTNHIGLRGVMMSRAMRRKLSQPRPVLDISIEPPSLAY